MLWLSYPFKKTKEKRPYNETEKKETQKKNFSTIIFNIFHHHRIYSHQSYETAMHEQLPDSLIEFEQNIRKQPIL